MNYSIKHHSEYIKSLTEAIGGQCNFNDLAARVMQAARDAGVPQSGPSEVVLNSPGKVGEGTRRSFCNRHTRSLRSR